jgi:hypothetical protein
VSVDEVPDLEDLLEAAARCAGLGALRLVEPLGGSPRSLVGRVGDGEATYVVKVARGEDGRDTWAREASALEAAGDSEVSPRLLGDDAARRLIVMTDLGSAPPVSDRLRTSAGPGTAVAADEGLVAWATALGRLHEGGAARAERYAALLERRDPGEEAHAMPRALDVAATQIGEHAETLGLRHDDAALGRLRGLTGSFTRPATVLSPGDACPDNNVMGAGDGRVTLLDFEFAEARHPAWDLAYLTVPWPTCWCSWRLPPGTRDRAVGAYVAAAGVTVDDAWRQDLALAAQGWALSSGGRMLPAALAGEPWDVPQMPEPRLRVRDRLETASRGPDPLLARLAGDLVRAVDARWHREPLPLAPAYRA